MKIEKLVKQSLLSLFVALAASSAGMAQTAGTITVAVPSSSVGPACTANVTSFSYGYSASEAVSPTGVTLGKPTMSPITLVKTLDQCSQTYLLELFRQNGFPTVVIVVPGEKTSSATPAPLLQITLTNARVSSISDNDQSGQSLVGSEKVTLVYESMKITDSTGRSTTCSFATNVCN